MNIYDARIKLTYCEEFKKRYIPLLRDQAEVAIKELEEQYGAEAAAEVRANLEYYIEYALTTVVKTALKNNFYFFCKCPQRGK